MSAKDLGQLHVVNYTQNISTAPSRLVNIDLPGQLTEQLQTMVRAGTYHKVVGIDMSLDTVGIVGGGQVSGSILYYAPTAGRCAAFRGAFATMKELMTSQGVKTSTNSLYDFKAPINELSVLSGPFPNRATLDGTTGLALYHSGSDGASIFGVHNRNVRPTYTGGTSDLFQPGFDTILQSAATGTDFVLNDTVAYSGNRMEASLQYETIPFTMSWTPDSTDMAVKFQWRPDPALFLAVMCGQMQVVIEELNLDGTAPGLNLNIAVTVSGWKSIMGVPGKKKSRSKKKSKKSFVTREAIEEVRRMVNKK